MQPESCQDETGVKRRLDLVRADFHDGRRIPKGRAYPTEENRWVATSECNSLRGLKRLK